MMRGILIISLLLGLAFTTLPSFGQTGPDIFTALNDSPNGESLVILDYLWVYGIEERVEIRGDGLLRAVRHVHTSGLFDQLRTELAQKGDLSPYGWSLYSMEEGEYDRYWVSDIGQEGFDKLVDVLADSGFPDIEETYGDWEVWAITLRAGDTEARVGRVVRDTHEGFESALVAIEKLLGETKNTGEVDEERFEEWFDEPKANMGGAS